MKILLMFVALWLTFLSLVVLSAPSPAPVEKPAHTHVWANWTTPEIKSDEWSGTRIYQTRTCQKCGLAEMVRTQVSAGK